MPNVSVIVPNYNHAPFLKQRIDSILSQSYQDFELILLDDCSTDGSREIIEAYRDNPHVTHVVCNDTNGGSAFRQWDKGTALAQGEWIWIAESDDYADPTFLEHMTAEVTKVSRCSLAYAATWWVDEHGNKLWDTLIKDEVNIYEGHDFIRRKMAICNSIANVSECIFRREYFRPSDCHRYEHMRLCGDWFFYILLAEQGYVVEVTQPLSYYRQHSSNISDDAEHSGLTFLEGIDVLDYMTTHCDLKAKDYARGWGRMWARYQQKYNFSHDVQNQIRVKISVEYPLIYAYFLLYKTKRYCKLQQSQ